MAASSSPRRSPTAAWTACAAGHEVDVQLGPDPGGAPRGGAGGARPDHPVGHQVTADVLAAGSRPRRGRPGRHRARQRRRRGGHPPGRDGGERAAVEHPPTAEHTMALLLAQARNVPAGPRRAHRRPVGAQRSGRASSWPTRRSASSASAASASSWPSGPRRSGCGSSPTTPSWPPSGPGRSTSSCSSLEELIEVADFVTLHVVKTPETLGMIGEPTPRQGQAGLRIVNVSRGGVIDEDALAEAIREGRIGGAALDVFATEPTTESPLFGLPDRWSSRPTSVPAPARPRTRRATRSPSRWPRAGRRVRALRRQRERGRGVRDGAPVPAARRAPRPAVRGAGRGRPGTSSRSSTRASWPTTTPASSRSRC